MIKTQTKLKEELIAKIVEMRAEIIENDALDCTSWKEEIRSLLRRGSPRYDEYTLQQLKDEVYAYNESRKGGVIEVDENENCIYCGQRCYEGDMCGEQLVGGFKR